MDKLRSMLSRNYEPQNNEEVTSPTSSSTQSPDGERGFIQDALDASSLSWSTRVKGFSICFCLGLGIAMLATVSFIMGFSLTTFALLYSLGNVTAIGSTLFLMGPINQIKRMFNSSRWIASTVMLVSLFLTLFSAFYLGKKGLTFLFFLIQFGAMTWYCLSYIPYARDLVKKTFNSMIS